MGFLKDTVYRSSPRPVQEGKQEMSAALISINEHKLTAVVQNFHR